MTISEQDKIIGNHPLSSDFFGKWLTFEDIPISSDMPHKKVRKLIANEEEKDNAIKQIAEWLIEHLVTDGDILDLRERKNKIYHKYSFEEHVKAQGLLPSQGTVMQGNFGEIIFTEYLKSLKKYDLLVYKLEYTTNVSQAMKGDDILMFDKKDLRKVLLGESKYRSVATKQTIEEILESFGGTTKLPISMTFISRRLRERNNESDKNIAKQLCEIQTEIKNREYSVINAGLIVSHGEKNYNAIKNHRFYGDFSLNSEVITKLKELDSQYPIKCIQGLIDLDRVFKTETLMIDEIKKTIVEDEVSQKMVNKKDKAKIKAEAEANAKEWTSKKYQEIIFENADKKANPSLFFIYLGMNELDNYLIEAFKYASEALMIPEILPLKQL
jgi:Cap4 SAVED domain